MASRDGAGWRRRGWRSKDPLPASENDVTCLPPRPLSSTYRSFRDSQSSLAVTSSVLSLAPKRTWFPPLGAKCMTQADLRPPLDDDCRLPRCIQSQSSVHLNRPMGARGGCPKASVPSVATRCRRHWLNWCKFISLPISKRNPIGIQSESNRQLFPHRSAWDLECDSCWNIDPAALFAACPLIRSWRP